MQIFLTTKAYEELVTFLEYYVAFLICLYISINKKLWIAEGRICFHRSNAPNSDADWSIYEKFPLHWEYPRNRISELWCCKNTNNLDTLFSIFAENGSPLRMNYTLSLTKISQVKSSRTPHSWFRVNVLFTTSGFLYVKGKYSLECIFSRCKYIYIGWASWYIKRLSQQLYYYFKIDKFVL